MGGEAARDQDRRQSAAAQDQHGRGPWRQVGPLGEAARGRGDLRVHPDAGRSDATRLRDCSCTAAPEHIDELGHVNNAVWVQWIQQVAVAHWEAVADPAHKDAYFWVVVRHEIDYLRAAHEGDRDHGADLGRRCAAGRAVRPLRRIHRRRRQGLRSREDAVGDYRQGVGPADPGAGGSDGAVRFARSKQRRHAETHPLRLLSLVRRLPSADRPQPQGRRL